MNIKQLKEAIKDLPDHMEVMIYNPDMDFAYNEAKAVGVKMVKFKEDPFDEESLSEEECFVLQDDLL